MTREEYNQQQLPKSDINENLETLSRNKLKSIFNANDFELRDELQHDKGIDLFGEIKTNNSNTNLRFPIQLKATQSVQKNQDGSISFQIKVSNINYLMNDGFPAYYILYHVNEDIFYFEKVQDVDFLLKEKYDTQNYPESFTIRFTKKLDQGVLSNIHSEVLSLGYLRRNLNEQIKLQPGNQQIQDTLVITKDQQVYSVEAKVSFIVEYGYYLLNEGKFQTITDLEKHCYPLQDGSPAFHFICGTAYHYQSQMIKALDHYKLAAKKKLELNPEIQNMLQYFTVQSKRSLGMIDAEKTSGFIETLMNSEYLGLFLKLQKAYEEHYTSDLPEPLKSEKFNLIIRSVTNDPNCDQSLSLIAESYVLTVEGHKLNTELINYLLHVRASMEVPFIDPQQDKPRADHIKKYNEQFKDLKDRALAHRNHYTYYLICLNGIKIQYMKCVFTDTILGADRNSLTIQSKLSNEEIDLLGQQAKFAGEIASAYEQLNSIENLVAALSQQYELLHFIGNIKEAEKVLLRMKDLLAENDLHGLEEKFRHLKDRGTTHETFASFILESLTNSNLLMKEVEAINAEIHAMDIEDQKRLEKKPDTHAIQLFPLGIYCFEKKLLDEIFGALNIAKEAEAGFRNMIKMGIMPVANVYNNPILKEGYANGEYDNEGIVNLRNLRQVRNNLRRVGAYKIIPEYGNH